MAEGAENAMHGRERKAQERTALRLNPPSGGRYVETAYAWDGARLLPALGFLAVFRKGWPQAIFWLLCMNTVIATRTVDKVI
jgi:hypothetical protein